jgi:voltage-gated potassium channel
VVESVDPIRDKYQGFFNGFEIFSVVCFSIEYVLRVWTANEDERFRKPVIGNIRYTMTTMAIIDLLAVLPFYLPLIGIDLRFLRILRLFRLFRMFKIARYMKALSLMNRVLKDKREELLISIVFTLFLLVIASTLMYYVENEAQPENFSSIPETMWWGIATLTTIGYGDVYPITGLGKFLGGIIALLGIGIFALPAGIMASGFSEHIKKDKKDPITCPSCGERITDNERA